MIDSTIKKHGLDSDSLLRFAAIVTVAAILLSAFSREATHFYYRMISADSVFQYESVTPIQDEFESGDEVMLRSVYKVHMKNRMVWNDVLRCGEKVNGIRPFFSSYQTSYNYTEKAKRDLIWTYHGITPTTPATCNFEHQITAYIHPDYPKHSTVIGPSYNFIKPKGL